MADPDLVRRVPVEDWRSTVLAEQAAGFSHFDWLGCVDDLGRDADFVVVVRLLAPDAGLDGVRISTRVPRDHPELASIADVFAGAGWHERESAELFELTFVGGNPRRLLLDDDASPGPLRKDQVLAARAAKDWPGAVEPGESAAPAGGVASGGRRRLSAPGVPDPQVWGDRRDDDPAEPEEVVRSSGGGRARRRP